MPSQPVFLNISSSLIYTMQQERNDPNYNQESSSTGKACCPLCLEELDETEISFYPCECGYQVCLWCLQNIRERLQNNCPACRKTYQTDSYRVVNSENPIGTKKPKRRSRDELREKRKEDSPQKRVQPVTPVALQDLKTVRVIQRNLAYVVGIPQSIARKEILKKPEFFGKYGQILNIVVNRSAHGDSSGAFFASQAGPTYSVYVTYARQESALRAIVELDSNTYQDCVLRASYGTTKYCGNFIRGVRCTSSECFYLHELGLSQDSFQKDEVVDARPVLTDIPTPHESPFGKPPLHSTSRGPAAPKQPVPRAPPLGDAAEDRHGTENNASNTAETPRYTPSPTIRKDRAFHNAAPLQSGSWASMARHGRSVEQGREVELSDEYFPSLDQAEEEIVSGAKGLLMTNRRSRSRSVTGLGASDQPADHTIKQTDQWSADPGTTSSRKRRKAASRAGRARDYDGKKDVWEDDESLPPRNQLATVKTPMVHADLTSKQSAINEAVPGEAVPGEVVLEEYGGRAEDDSTTACYGLSDSHPGVPLRDASDRDRAEISLFVPRKVDFDKLRGGEDLGGGLIVPVFFSLPPLPGGTGKTVEPSDANSDKAEATDKRNLEDEKEEERGDDYDPGRYHPESKMYFLAKLLEAIRTDRQEVSAKSIGEGGESLLKYLHELIQDYSTGRLNVPRRLRSTAYVESVNAMLRNAVPSSQLYEGGLGPNQLVGRGSPMTLDTRSFFSFPTEDTLAALSADVRRQKFPSLDAQMSAQPAGGSWGLPVNYPPTPQLSPAMMNNRRFIRPGIVPGITFPPAPNQTAGGMHMNGWSPSNHDRTSMGISGSTSLMAKSTAGLQGSPMVGRGFSMVTSPVTGGGYCRGHHVNSQGASPFLRFSPI